MGSSSTAVTTGWVNRYDKRPRAFVAEHAAEERSLGDLLLEELYRFTGEDWEQEDDITLLTLRRSAARS